MKIKVSCPGCQNSSPVDTAVLGKKLRCPSCNLIFRTQRAPPQATTSGKQNQPIPLAESRIRDPAAPAGVPPGDPGIYWSTAGKKSEPAELSRAEQYALAQDGQQRPALATPKKREMDDFAKGMSNLGFYFLLVGLVAAVLPLFGLQLRRLQGLSDYGLFAGLPLIVAGIFLIGGARTRNPKLFAGIAAVAGSGTLTLMLGGKFFFDQVSEPSLAGQVEPSRQTDQSEARPFRNNSPQSEIVSPPTSNGKPFEPDLNKNWNSTYSTIHWQEGWYGSKDKTILITDQGWDASLGRYIVEGTWGRTTNASMKGGIRFEFDSPHSFTGHWWYDRSPNRRFSWSGTSR